MNGSSRPDFFMSSRFQPESDSKTRPTPESVLIDPEAFDASEQEFAASLETAIPAPRFVPEPAAAIRVSEPEEETAATQPEAVERREAREPVEAEDEAGDPDRWRQEVAARVNQYRARRRPRGPRYPSLKLDFGPGETVRTAALPRNIPPVESRPAITREAAAPAVSPRIQMEPAVAEESTARIIEFPHPSWEPTIRLDELAEPVFDRPRILEVPETPAAPPALGGILLEPQEAPELEKRPGFEIPLQPAPLWRRWTAAAVDLAFVLFALAGFGEIFSQIVRSEPPLRVLVASAAVLMLTFWAGYQYLLLVCADTTPGLWLARLQVCRFDGTRAVRRVRRWRVIAAALSAAALGLGYAWSFLDEDGLCWHDRITRTYLAPAAPRAEPDLASVSES
jgi:hypothetical protein